MQVYPNHQITTMAAAPLEFEPPPRCTESKMGGVNGRDSRISIANSRRRRNDRLSILHSYRTKSNRRKTSSSGHAGANGL